MYNTVWETCLLDSMLENGKLNVDTHIISYICCIHIYEQGRIVQGIVCI